jgi:hypothetical protein
MRHADIEEEIMERGVHQRKGKDETPVGHPTGPERATTATGHGQYNQTGSSKPDARKEHLATRHVGCDSKSAEAYLDERKCPAPCDGSGQGKNDNPGRSSEYRASIWFHQRINPNISQNTLQR